MYSRRGLNRGLSPPTRGSRRRHQDRVRGRGSIPAHTGKPLRVRCLGAALGVYPRPHGEACTSTTDPREPSGLSPPTRGSPHDPERDAHAGGSIPAHTGKPRWSGARGSTRRVYPRPHGEAIRVRMESNAQQGLSPPTRGSRRRRGRRPPWRRSIPAHTGKPRRAFRSPCRIRVYPRPHGEASRMLSMLPSFRGLSPPTRGSLAVHPRLARLDGSIPAHTGKPITWPRVASWTAVYPRPHGEASCVCVLNVLVEGLSPPTRGSRVGQPGRERVHGSIPAHTGKPA